MFTARNTCNGIDDEAEECPEESRDHCKRPSQGLDRKTSGVCIGYIICASGVALELIR